MLNWANGEDTARYDFVQIDFLKREKKKLLSESLISNYYTLDTGNLIWPLLQ